MKSFLTLLVGGLWLVVWACAYNPMYEGVRCGSFGECPEGYLCVGEGTEARCTSTPLPEDGSHDGTADDGGSDGGDPADAADGIDAADGADAADGVDAGSDAQDEETICPDADQDGYKANSCGGDDCDDADSAVHPGASEGPRPDPTCSDGKDNDCDGFIDGQDPVCQRPWWDESWTRRRKISFKNLAQAENLIDFPVLVILDASRIDFTKTRNNGEDLRFVDADDATGLSYELELWDNGASSYAWVKVPQIDGGTDADFIWMYYGNGKAADMQDPAGVWSNGYQAVYHLHADFNDSTGNNLHGVNHGSSDALGRIANGQVFNDSNGQYIDLGQDRPFLRNITGCTLSAWVSPANIGYSDDLMISISVYNGGSTTLDSRATMGLTNQDEVLIGGRSLDNDSYHSLTANNRVYVNQWYFLTGVLDYQGRRMTIYVNGSEVQAAADVNFSDFRTSDTPSANSAIGSQDDHSANFLDGVLDEVRIEVTVRSANWIAAQHLSMTDAFLQFHPEEQ